VGSVVQVHPDPPQLLLVDPRPGAIAQLGERLLCKQEVTGSIPVGSTRFSSELSAKRNAFRFAVSFIRLLFKNSEEVKRTRFSQTGFVWVVIALLGAGALSASVLNQALSMTLCDAPPRREAHRLSKRCSGL
jgi:hypothetical protein